MKPFALTRFTIILIASIYMVGCTSSPAPTSLPSLTTTFSASSDLPRSPTDDPYLSARLEMVGNTIQARGITDPAVIEAMRSVPRHLFVPEEYLSQAYEDHPLPIGFGQTISQPYMVAWMTELLELQPGEKVLEIGSGSGYQAAILAALGSVDIYTIEIVPELAQSAEKRLKSLGYSQIKTLEGDGYYGWPDYAPYDAIIVTAAPDHLPSPLVGQLAEDGRLIIPIGPPGFFQSLWKFVEEEGEIKGYNLGSVAFVPFTGPGVESGSGTPLPNP